MEGFVISGFGLEEVPGEPPPVIFDCDGLVNLQGGDDSALVSGVSVSMCDETGIAVGGGGSPFQSSTLFALAGMVNSSSLGTDGVRAPPSSVSGLRGVPTATGVLGARDTGQSGVLSDI